MSLVELPTSRARTRRVGGGVETSARNQSIRSTNIKPQRSHLGFRRGELEKGDDIHHLPYDDGEDKLKQALRRSASAMSPPQPSGSEINPSRTAEHRQAGVSPVRLRRRILKSAANESVEAIHDLEFPFVSTSDPIHSHNSGPLRRAQTVACFSSSRATSITPEVKTTTLNDLTTISVPTHSATTPRKDSDPPSDSSRLSFLTSSPLVTSPSPSRRAPLAAGTSEHRLAQIRARLSKATEEASPSRQIRNQHEQESSHLGSRSEEGSQTKDESDRRSTTLPEQNTMSQRTDISAAKRSIASARQRLEEIRLLRDSAVSLGATSPSAGSEEDPVRRKRRSRASLLLDSSPTSRSRLLLKQNEFDNHPEAPNAKTSSFPCQQRSEDSETSSLLRPLASAHDVENASPLLQRGRAEESLLQASSVINQPLSRDEPPSPSPSEASLARLAARRQRKSMTSSEPVSRFRLQRPVPDAPLTAKQPQDISKLKTSLGRHRDRLLETENGADEAGNSPRKEVAPAVSPPRATSSSTKETMTFLERARASRARAQSSAAGSLVSKKTQSQTEEKEQVEVERPPEEEVEKARLNQLKKINRRRTLQTALVEHNSDEARVEREVALPLEQGRPCQKEEEVLVNNDRAERNAVRLQRGRSMYSLITSPQSVDGLDSIHSSSSQSCTQNAIVSASISSTTSSLLRRRASMGGYINDSVLHVPKVESRPSDGLFKGVVALVDVRAQDGADDSPRWVKLLKEHGAKVAARIPSTDSRRTLTHIIWKNGRPSTLKFFRGLEEAKKPLIVGPGWVVGCMEHARRCEEDWYLVEVGKEVVWQKQRNNSTTPVKELSPLPPSSPSSSLLDKNIRYALEAVLEHAPLVSSPLRTHQTSSISLVS